jgi:hypothetical protein
MVRHDENPKPPKCSENDDATTTKDRRDTKERISTAELSLSSFVKAELVRHHGDNGVPVAVLEAEQLWTVRFQKAEKECTE